MEHIIQWNVRGMTSGKPNLLQLIKDIHPSLIVAQDTFYGDHYMARTPNYTGICKQGHFNERCHGSVGLYMHASCPYQQIDINSENQVIAVRAHPSQTKTITVASIYVSGSTAITKASLGNVIRQLPHPYLLL